MIFVKKKVNSKWFVFRIFVTVLEDFEANLTVTPSEACLTHFKDQPHILVN